MTTHRQPASSPPFDVAIAGAGPAGALAALLLAREGARVCLVERAVFPRDKLCGDTLNPGAVALLHRVGLASRLRPSTRPIGGMVLSGLFGVTVTARYQGRGVPELGWAVRRRDLDAVLLTAAVEAGAEVLTGVRVEGPIVDDGPDGPRVDGLLLAGRRSRQPTRLPARITIAADGRRSVVARALGLARVPRSPRRWVVGGYFDQVQGLTDLGEMHIRGDHYIGVAPLPGGLANVCAVSAVRDRFARPAVWLQQVLSEDPRLSDRFTDARLVQPPVSLGPMAVDAEMAGIPGLLLAGDAAGFVDPITGDGVRLALRGGELAACAARSMLHDAHNPGHVTLAGWRAQELARKHRFNRAVRVLIGSRLGVAAGSVGAALLPTALRRLVAHAGDLYLGVPRPAASDR